MEITVTTYSELESHIESFFEQVVDLLVIRGQSGTGKTYTIKQRTDNDEGIRIAGEISPLATYKKLWRNRDKPIVLDDIETLMMNRKRRSLLKNLADTYEVKELEWDTTSPQLNPAPQSFTTTSNVCLIANELNARGLNQEALLGRGLVLDFWPTENELVNRMETVTKNYNCGLSLDERYEVFEFIQGWIPFADEANLRTLVIGFQLKEGGKDWRNILQRGMNIDERLIAIANLVDIHDKVEDAAREFQEQTGYSQRTFYTLKKKLPEA